MLKFPESKQLVGKIIQKALPAGNGYPPPFRVAKGEGSEEEKEWGPTSITTLAVQIGSLKATSPYNLSRY